MNFATLPSDILAIPWYRVSIRGIAGNGQLAAVREAAEGGAAGLPLRTMRFMRAGHARGEWRGGPGDAVFKLEIVNYLTVN